MASESESEKRKTLADIVAEMRRGTKLPGYWRSCDLNKILKYHADRIEAAWKQERAEVEANALAVGGLVEAERQRVVVSKTETTTVGNAAAMREALSDACYAMFNFLKTQNGGYEEMANALDKAKAALSAPARNCDLFGGDPRMLRTAWFDWTASPSGHDANGAAKMTFAGWLLAPAAERKGEAYGK